MKMATDVDIQYFSHLNGLTLDNNWGDLIRLLDKALVTGIDFTQITAASIDAQGDVHITLYAAHNAMLFQVVELTGFTPVSLNQKYRIKGVPNTTQLILKPAIDITDRSITAIGAGKLASLGYDIIFRDTGDVKRVYRAKNPRAEHPFIRVDETISDGTNSYTSTYAKSAMIGLLENMAHIDDYQDSSKLQLPLDTSNFAKNWKITGSGTNCIRGWCKWTYANFSDVGDTYNESGTPKNGNRPFTLCGSKDAFYLLTSATTNAWKKVLYGCGLFNNTLDNSIVQNWFLMCVQRNAIASSGVSWYGLSGITPLFYDDLSGKFLTTKYNIINKIQPSVAASPIMPDSRSGQTGLYSSNYVAALEIPFSDSDKYLKGSLKHIFYSGNVRAQQVSTPVLSDTSMYIWDSAFAYTQGGVYFYLGELE